MKRHGHLFHQAFTAEALLAAFHRAARGKRNTRACFQFEKHLASNLDALHQELHNGTYQPRPYYSFMVYEPKARTIYAPAFRDLVVQHAIYAVVGPIFDPGFIDQSFACRVGHGTHRAAHYTQAALQACPPDSYTLKLDVRKFFYRIDRTVLRSLIERKIKDQRFVDLMMAFTDHGEPVGIPIGNLLSQLYALIYLNPVDHYIKRVLRVRHYCRYVDDLVLFGLDLATSKTYRIKISEQLAALGLELSKSSIAKVKRGINFVGYRTWSSRRFVRRRALANFRRAIRRSKTESAVSLIGHAKHTHSQRHMLHLAKDHNHALYRQLPKNRHPRNHAPAESA